MGFARGEYGTAYGPKVSQCCMLAGYGCAGQYFQPPHHQLFLSPEQCLGRIAMRGSRAAVFLDPVDLGFEQCDPHRQFILRIGAEVLDLIEKVEQRVLAETGIQLVREVRQWGGPNGESPVLAPA